MVAPILLAIDPGARTGFAVLNSDAALCDCGSEARDDLIARLAPYRGIPAIVLELPFYRGVERTPGDPNQLIKLAACVAEQAGRLAGTATVISMLKPDEWKGRIKKEVHQNRFAERIGRTVPETWRAYWDAANHDTRDAIALLHWAAEKAGIQCR
jgi:hypothetical protein